MVYLKMAMIEKAEMIETGIGPLPADLWSLIGERPPTRQPAASYEAGPESPATAPALPKVRPEIRRRTREDMPQPELRTATRPPAEKAGPAISETIQREPETSGSTETEATPTPEPAGAAGAAGGVNMDELANKVYGEVKRRLSVEWERLRRRL